MMPWKKSLLAFALALCMVLSGCGTSSVDESNGPDAPAVSSDVVETDDGSASDAVEPSPETPSSEEPDDQEPATSSAPTETVSASQTGFSLSDVPAYSGDPYIVVNGNEPFFSDSELTTTSFETYSSLDSLGRCGVAYACVGIDLMPTEDRGSIGQVRPTGWHTVRYDVVDGQYLYNRCHLIGYQLSGENANERNLITGTRYMNVDGMLPFENMVADYVQETSNHVMYRVTPYFDGDNLLATGVLMEAKSVEDNGDGVLYNVFVYNSQPGIVIDYATGDSWLESGGSATTETQQPVATPTPTPEPESTTGQTNSQTYILNTNTHKFHYPSCSSVNQMNESNKQEYSGTRDEVIAMGYDPCGRCNP